MFVLVTVSLFHFLFVQAATPLCSSPSALQYILVSASYLTRTESCIFTRCMSHGAVKQQYNNNNNYTYNGYILCSYNLGGVMNCQPQAELSIRVSSYSSIRIRAGMISYQCIDLSSLQRIERVIDQEMVLKVE